MRLDEFILGSKERVVKAFLDLVILHLLSKHAMSGYEIDKSLVKKFGLMIGPSTIYSKLSTLEKQGFISCATSRSGKVYKFDRRGKTTPSQYGIRTRRCLQLSDRQVAKQKLKKTTFKPF